MPQRSTNHKKEEIVDPPSPNAPNFFRNQMQNMESERSKAFWRLTWTQKATKTIRKPSILTHRKELEVAEKYKPQKSEDPRGVHATSKSTCPKELSARKNIPNCSQPESDHLATAVSRPGVTYQRKTQSPSYKNRTEKKTTSGDKVRKGEEQSYDPQRDHRMQNSKQTGWSTHSDRLENKTICRADFVGIKLGSKQRTRYSNLWAGTDLD